MTHLKPMNLRIPLYLILWAGSAIAGNCQGAILSSNDFFGWEAEVVNYFRETGSRAFFPDGNTDTIGVSIGGGEGRYASYVLLRDARNGISGSPVSINLASIGGITSVDFKIDVQNITGFGQGQIVNLLVIQDGQAYIASAGASADAGANDDSLSGTFEARHFSRLRTDFVAPGESWLDQASKPDFSKDGAPLRFGFAPGVSSNFGAFIQVEYDNFLVDFEHVFGGTQSDPILPGYVTDDGAYVFESIPSGQWYDPVVSDYHFETLDGSLFKTILDFPVGFDRPFDVYVGETRLGSFSPGSSVDFGAGVSEFSVRGISPLVDSNDPLGFPIKLGFDRQIVSFQMTPITTTNDPVPEPSSFAVFGIVLLGFVFRRRRRSIGLPDRQ